MKNRISIYSVIHAVIFGLSIVTDWYFPLAFILTGCLIIQVLDRLGKGIVLREIVALHMTFTCLAMPVIGYKVYNRSNHLALIFLKYMHVPDFVYFGYALPAVSGFVLFLCWPVANKEYDDGGAFLQRAIDRAKTILAKSPRLGIYLLGGGTVMFQVARVLPEAVQFAFLLFFFAGFAAFLYIFYQPGIRGRRYYLFGFGAFIVLTAIGNGMFTVVAYMSLTIFSFFFLGKRSSMFKKLTYFCVGVFILLLIQSIKPTYRIMTWSGNYDGNKTALFLRLIGDKLSHPDFSSADAFFQIFTRANQGFNVSLVMNRFPEKVPFDDGNKLFLNIASSLVPRVFWPNKPEAGGRANMSYYAGLNIIGWSTNVGPLGESYGSFGPRGGVIFMILLGIFIRFAYTRMFKLSARIPLLLFWLPVMFYQTTYAGETDTLQILNSILKSALFIWLLHRQWPEWFGGKKKRPGIVIQPEYEMDFPINPAAD
ncbi:MAG TPA: hypothetical protein VFE32_06475 [Puia sp.]|nr:hypothetical protein [Puia sp.]